MVRHGQNWDTVTVGELAEFVGPEGLPCAAAAEARTTAVEEVQLFVSASHGSDGSDCGSATSPCQSLRQIGALVSAVSANTSASVRVSVQVAAGVYAGGAVFHLHSNVQLTIIFAVGATTDCASNVTGALSTVFIGSARVTIIGGMWRGCTNSTSSGGALQFRGGVAAELQSAMFAENNAYPSGGAVYADRDSALLSIVDCHFVNNSVVMPNTTVISVSAVIGGGAVSTEQLTDLEVLNTTFVSCLVQGVNVRAAGGAMLVWLSDITAGPAVLTVTVESSNFVNCSVVVFQNYSVSSVLSTEIGAFGGAFALLGAASSGERLVQFVDVYMSVNSAQFVALTGFLGPSVTLGGGLCIKLAGSSDRVELRGCVFVNNSVSSMLSDRVGSAGPMRAEGGAVVVDVSSGSAVRVTQCQLGQNGVRLAGVRSPEQHFPESAIAVGGGLSIAVSFRNASANASVELCHCIFFNNSVGVQRIHVARWLVVSGGGAAVHFSLAAAFDGSTGCAFRSNDTLWFSNSVSATDAGSSVSVLVGGGSLWTSVADLSHLGSRASLVSISGLRCIGSSVTSARLVVRGVSAPSGGLAGLLAVCGGSVSVSIGAAVQCGGATSCSRTNSDNSIVYANGWHSRDFVTVSRLASLQGSSRQHISGGGVAINVGLGMAATGVPTANDCNSGNAVAVISTSWTGCSLLAYSTGVSVASTGSHSAILQLKGGGLSIGVGDIAWYSFTDTATNNTASNSVVLTRNLWDSCWVVSNASTTAIYGASTTGTAAVSTSGGAVSVSFGDGCFFATTSGAAVANIAANSVGVEGGVWLDCMVRHIGSTVLADSNKVVGAAVHQVVGGGLSISFASFAFFAGTTASDNYFQNRAAVNAGGVWTRCSVVAILSFIQMRGSSGKGAAVHQQSGGGLAVVLAAGTYYKAELVGGNGQENVFSLRNASFTFCSVESSGSQSELIESLVEKGDSVQHVCGGGAALVVSTLSYFNPGADSASNNAVRNLVEVTASDFNSCLVTVSNSTAVAVSQSQTTSASMNAQFVAGAGLAVSVVDFGFFAGTSHSNTLNNSVAVTYSVFCNCALAVNNSLALASGAAVSVSSAVGQYSTTASLSMSVRVALQGISIASARSFVVGSLGLVGGASSVLISTFSQSGATSVVALDPSDGMMLSELDVSDVSVFDSQCVVQNVGVAFGCSVGVDCATRVVGTAVMANVSVERVLIQQSELVAFDSPLVGGAGFGLSFANELQSSSSSAVLDVTVVGMSVSGSLVRSVRGSVAVGGGAWMSAGVRALVTDVSTLRMCVNIVQAVMTNNSVHLHGGTDIVRGIRSVSRPSAAGGAIAIMSGTVRLPSFGLSGSSFAWNAVYSSGVGAGGALGILPVDSQTPFEFQVTNCTFAGNKVSALGAYGGALELGPFDPTVVNRQFTGSVRSSVFSRNLASAVDMIRVGGVGRAQASGGAMYSACNALELGHSVFEDNLARSNTLAMGGAVLVTEIANVSACQFVDNSAVAQLVDSLDYKTIRWDEAPSARLQTVGSGTARGGAVAALFDLDQRLAIMSSSISASRADTGAAIFVKCLRACILTVTDSVIGNCSAAVDGGAMALADVAGSVQRTLFVANSAQKTGGALFVILSTQPFEAVDCVFVNNTGQVGGSVSVATSGMLSAAGTVFLGNRALFRGGAVSVDGAASLTQSNVTDNQALVSGGGLAVSGSLHMDTVLSSGNEAGVSGGAILVSDAAFLNATGLRLFSSVVSRSDQVGTGGGGIVVKDNARVVLSDMLAFNNTASAMSSTGGTILVQDAASTEIMRATVIASRAGRGGAIACLGCNLFASGFHLRRNTASVEGGGVFVALTESSTVPTVVLQDGLVQANTALRGAGIFWDLTGVELPPALCGTDAATNSTCWTAQLVQRRIVAIANTALSAGSQLLDSEQSSATALVNAPGAGGGIFYDLPTESTTVSSMFAVLWDLVAHKLNDSIVFEANTAQWGLNVATSAVRVTPAVQSGAPLVRGPAGWPVTLPLQVLDMLDQEMTTLQGVTVFCAGTACDPNHSLLPVHNGTAVASLSHAGPIGRTYNASFSLLDSGLDSASSVLLQVTVCPLGAGLAVDTGVCVQAPLGTYSLNGSLPYLPCPVSAVCVGGTSVFLTDTFWPFARPDAGVFIPLPCPYDFCSRGCDVPGVDAQLCLATVDAWRLDSACALPRFVNLTTDVCVLDVLNETRQNRFCKFGSYRTGVLCGECEPGYAYWDRYCLPCNDGVTVAQRVQALMGRLSLLLVPTLVAHWAAQSDSGVAGFKIFVFVYQLASLALFPSEILDNVLGVTANALRKFVSLLSSSLQDIVGSPVCPFYTSPEGMVAVQLVQPLIKLLFTLIVWCLQAAVLKLLDVFVRRGSVSALRVFLVLSRGSDRSGLVRTLLVVSITQFEGVVETLFSVLACQPDTGRVYLIPALPCSGPLQTASIVLVVLVSGLPFVLGAYLIWLRSRDNLRDEFVLERFGVLYYEYKERWCFWEAWMLLRRVLLLGFFVLGVSQYDVPTAKMVLALLVGFLLVTHFLVRPYASLLNNYLETFGLSLLLLLVAVNGQSTEEYQRGVATLVLLVLGAAVLLAPLAWRAWTTVIQLLRSDLRALRQQQQQMLHWHDEHVQLPHSLSTVIFGRTGDRRQSALRTPLLQSDRDGDLTSLHPL